MFRLKKTFGCLVQISAEEDAERRGAFEVDLNGLLVHSKLTNSDIGDACCSTEVEKQYIVAKVCAALGLSGSLM